MARVRTRLSAWLAGAFVLLLVLLPRDARADRPVIESGRDAEVVALFAPYPLGGEVVPGWRLMWLRVETTHIEVVVEGTTPDKAGLLLEHPDYAPGVALRSRSFAITRDPPAPSAPGAEAVDRLVAALAQNDRGGFWRAEGDESPSGGRRPPGRLRPLVRLRSWATDGTVLSLFGLLVLGSIVASQLRGASAWIRGGLAAVVVGGGALRWLIAPEVALGAWPYSRLIHLHRHIFHGPLLASATRWLDARVHLTDVVFVSNFVFSTLTPLAVFAHMRHVSRDARVALAAAALLAVLPNHIRFSRSEVEFMPSLLLSSLTFALLHTALADPGRVRRWFASALLPLALIASVWTRELNILLVPLLWGAAAYLGPEDVPRPRRLLVAGGVAVGGAAALVEVLLRFPTQVREGLAFATVANGLFSLFSLHDTLVNPWITPPGITLLAAAGAVLLWRARGHDRRQAIFLLSWLALFYFAHAYVTPKEVAMQARYHLHLAPPFVMLAAPALTTLLDRRAWAGRAAIGYVAASPLLHLGFERDVGFNDLREFAFVRAARDRIPEGCTVLEYTGQGTGDLDARFGRMGTVLDRGEVGSRFLVVPVGAAPGGDPLRPEARLVVAELPACVMLYEGIPCYSEKSATAPIAPACAALESGLRLEPVAETRFPSRPYDENLAKGFGELHDVPLALYRVLGRKDDGGR